TALTTATTAASNVTATDRWAAALFRSAMRTASTMAALIAPADTAAVLPSSRHTRTPTTTTPTSAKAWTKMRTRTPIGKPTNRDRSEERRVGKEERTRKTPNPTTNKK